MYQIPYVKVHSVEKQNAGETDSGTERNKGK